MGVLCGDIEVSLHLGRKTPANFTDDDLKNIRHLNAWVRQFEYVKDLPKAKNKYKLEKILSMFDGRIKSSSQSIKWTFLSGHDLEIVPMFTDLNLSSSQCVEELYRNGETSALNCEQYPQFATSLIF